MTNNLPAYCNGTIGEVSALDDNVVKGQGQTLEDVYVDLSRGFATGQAYTALSRVRNISGLHLLVPFDVGQIIFNPDVAGWL